MAAMDQTHQKNTSPRTTPLSSGAKRPEPTWNARDTPGGLNRHPFRLRPCRRICALTISLHFVPSTQAASVPERAAAFLSGLDSALCTESACQLGRSRNVSELGAEDVSPRGARAPATHGLPGGNVEFARYPVIFWNQVCDHGSR